MNDGALGYLVATCSKLFTVFFDDITILTCISITDTLVPEIIISCHLSLPLWLMFPYI